MRLSRHRLRFYLKTRRSETVSNTCWARRVPGRDRHKIWIEIKLLTGLPSSSDADAGCAARIPLIAVSSTRKLPQLPAILGMRRWRGGMTIRGDNFAMFPYKDGRISCSPAPSSLFRSQGIVRRSLLSQAEFVLAGAGSQKFPASREIAVHCRSDGSGQNSTE
jgi:hypothetical protein